MILDKFSLVNFKNIADVSLTFSPKLNCFVGQNGAGKTNLLDAIYYLSFCKSAFQMQDTYNVRHGEQFFMVQGRYAEGELPEEEISCGFHLGQRRKSFRRNGKEYARLSEHIGRIPLVLVSPRDTDMISGPAEERRRFMNMVISQYDPTYLQELVRYQKTLKQRNALLKMETDVDDDFLDTYDAVLTDAGQKIFSQRQRFLEEFVPMFRQVYLSLVPEGEDVGLKYHSQVTEADFMETLQKMRTRDKILGYTSWGVHRDDMEMTQNGYDVRREGSQGQTKTYMIALKLAQFHFMGNKKRSIPLLLLDDIFDKLDASRVERILQLVSHNAFGQIFITDTDRNYISEIIARTGMDAKVFDVENGNVSEEKEQL